jgi:rhodanese-related sulfurtransferase
MRRAVALLACVACAVATSAPPVAATHSLGPAPSARLVSAEYLRGVLDTSELTAVIDIRPGKDYERSRMPGARSIPLSQLRTRVAEIPRSGVVIVYCACRPGEEWHAYELLYVRGYRNVAILAGGFAAWLGRGYPIEQG